MQIENMQTVINSTDFTFMIWSKVIQTANIDIIFYLPKYGMITFAIFLNYVTLRKKNVSKTLLFVVFDI
jgi:hypothetical protein